MLIVVEIIRDVSLVAWQRLHVIDESPIIAEVVSAIRVALLVSIKLQTHEFHLQSEGVLMAGMAGAQRKSRDVQEPFAL